MIRKDAYGISPDLTVAIDGVPVNYYALNEVELFMEENMHDMCVLRMSGLPPESLLGYRNRPVQVLIDAGASYYQEFVGYVTDIRPMSMTKDGLMNGSPFQDAAIVCLGVSYEFRGDKSFVWADHRLQDVVAALCNAKGFSAEVPNDTLILSPMLQQSESDWQFMVRYAKQLGYAMTMHGTTLHVFDPYMATSRNISFNRLVSAKNLGRGVRAHPGQITKLNASLTENHPDGKYKDTVVTVHEDELGLVYDVSLRELRGLSAPARFADRVPDSVDSYEQAVRAINARTKEFYDYNAEVTCLGVAGCKPGGVVEIADYEAAIDGLWYVRSVRHSVTSGVFTSDLCIARNIESELLLPSSAPAFRPASPSVLRSGVWASSKRSVNVY